MMSDTIVVEKRPIEAELERYIAARLKGIQEARLDTLEDLTLEEIFAGSNPYLLRSSFHAVEALFSQSLERYLYTRDKAAFDRLAHDIKDFADRLAQPIAEPAEILESFAGSNLPLRFVVQEASDRCHNRLLGQFYLRFSNEDASINWQRLARFVSACNE